MLWDGLLAHHEYHASAEHNTAENKYYAENIADCYIGQGSFPITDLKQLQCLPGKSGKCCKAAQEPGKNKKAPFMGPVGLIEQAPDETYEKGTQEINGKCSCRENGSCKTLDKKKHSVAAGSPDRSSSHNC